MIELEAVALAALLLAWDGWRRYLARVERMRREELERLEDVARRVGAVERTVEGIQARDSLRR